METRPLRSRPIRALLASEVISTTGAQMTWVALPWFVLTTTGSATRMSLVMAAELIGLALAGFPSGRLINRIGARRTMCSATRFGGRSCSSSRCCTGWGRCRSRPS